jgi:hypothetical protein
MEYLAYEAAYCHYHLLRVTHRNAHIQKIAARRVPLSQGFDLYGFMRKKEYAKIIFLVNTV